MPTLATSDFNIVTAVLGGFVLSFGLVSYFVKERLYLSEALIALCIGVALGPYGANFIRPNDYASNSSAELESITLAFTRLVLGVQLVLAGVQLPKKYLLKEWKSLAWLLGPIMTGKWLVTALLVWGLIPQIAFLDALAFAACVTPTDPILANTIVKGKFADAHIPPSLQKIIIAESGANDGLGYPFLFLPLYLIKYVTLKSTYSGGARHAIGLWFGETIGYEILLSVAYGSVVGWLAKELLHWAEKKKLVDRESFLVFAFALALFIMGTCGMIGSDDVLACFIAGNVFTMDDWFRVETADDSLQPTIDMLLNITIFLWFGAVCPWPSFNDTPHVPLSRVVGLGLLVILLRRPPIVMLLHKFVPRIASQREALFAGYFGPIGVSAIFYLYVAREFFEGILANKDLDSVGREKIERAKECVVPVVWVCVIASVVVHGITVPIIKLGNAIPLTASASFLPALSRNSTNVRGSQKNPRTPIGLGTRIPNAPDAAAPDAQDPSVNVAPKPATSSSKNGSDNDDDDDDDEQGSIKSQPRAARRSALEPGLPTSAGPSSPTLATPLASRSQSPTAQGAPQIMFDTLPKPRGGEYADAAQDPNRMQEDGSTPVNEDGVETMDEGRTSGVLHNAPMWQRQRKIKIVDTDKVKASEQS